MATQDTPRNRKERRAQARSNPHTKDFPLAHPARDAPKGKTLLEIAEERRLLQRSEGAQASVTTAQINPNGSLFEFLPPSPPTSDATGTYLDILLYSVSLTLLHFTLTLLVHHQYAVDRPSLWPLFLSSVVFSKTPWLILLLVAALHPRSGHLILQVGFAAMALVAGTWLVYASNEDPYMAVMTKAPALGTLWVWAIIELRWEVAVACLAVTGAWGWLNGYGIR